MELEGLRGIAAIAVVAYHCLQAFYPFAIYGGLDPQHMRFEDNYYGTIFAGLTSGVFAVAIFFVLSGFVLTIGYFQTKKLSIVKGLATKRYIRLMLPALASTLICLAVIKLGFANNLHAAAANQSHWFLQFTHWSGEAQPVIGAIQEGILGIFTNFSGDSLKLFNPVLWTMTTEFVGSFVVFGFLFLFAESRYRWLVYGALFVFLFNTWMLGFILGMLLADLYSHGVFSQKKRGLAAFLLLPIGLFFGAYPRAYTTGTIYEGIPIRGLEYNSVPVDFQMISTLLGATILVFAVIYIKQAANVLSWKRVSNLGKYTFSLYLTHIPIIMTLTAGLFATFSAYMGYNRSVALAIVISVPVFIAATVLFERYIDAPSIRLAKFFANVYDGKEQVRARERLLQVALAARLKLSSMSSTRSPDFEE